ncbi:mannan endo-1,4-beta-mannosidase B [Aspergillus pseudodeflectus]|uniref:mannan endo-1,4-beta-mannosidase n=1 Tax=Aspergillus pseudodeflectus TaxID=176178 RepID=A0ABR4JDF2_9EURO
MRFAKGSLLALAAGLLPALVTAEPAAPPAYTAPAVPIGRGGGHIPRTVGRLFEIDGKVQYFAGTNCWWLGNLLDDSEVELAISQMADTGYKVVRTWGFFGVNDPTNPGQPTFYQVLNETLYKGGWGINYGPNGIHRLDVVVSLAEKYGIKLVMVLMNNWNDFGGINIYSNAFGSNATTFYTNPDAQRAYRNYVKFIVNRYKSSSAIFSWELGNEPRCKGCDPSVIYNWATEISQMIKKIDRKHMVTLGDEGWLCPPEGDGTYAYDCSEGVDFVRNLEIKTLDYGTFHMYPESWGYNYTWGNEWIRQHDAIGARAGKPVKFEEYGAPINHTEIERPWQLTVLKETSLAADFIWQFGSVLPESGTTWGDVNSIYYGTEEYEILGFKHVAEMRRKRVRHH